jgi:hypothetical protein
LQDAGSFPERPDGAIAARDFRDGALGPVSAETS